MIQTPLPVLSDDSERARFHPISNLMLALTDRCNLRCTYCFVEKTPRRMSRETARQAVDFFLHRNISGVNPHLAITFFGGEPFVELDLMEEVIDYTRAARPDSRKQVRFAATTNATVVGPRVERMVRDHRFELLISFDGKPAASGYRPFDSGKSSYALVARNLPKLTSWAAKAIVRMTYHPGALDLAGNAAHALELGASSVTLASVVESDWTGHEAALEQAYLELAEWFIRSARQGRLLPLESTWIMLRRLDAARHGAPRQAAPCGVARTLLGIDPDGNVMPCHRFLYRPQDWLGRVDQPVLRAARNQYLDLSSSQLQECQGCEAERVCGGGCRAVALGAGRDLKGVHPGHCLNTRAHLRSIVHIYDTLMQEGNLAFLRQLRSPHGLSPALTELALN